MPNSFQEKVTTVFTLNDFISINKCNVTWSNVCRSISENSLERTKYHKIGAKRKRVFENKMDGKIGEIRFR